MLKAIGQGLKILLVWQICNLLFFASLLLLLGVLWGVAVSRDPSLANVKGESHKVVAGEKRHGKNQGVILELHLDGIIARSPSHDGWMEEEGCYERILGDLARAEKDKDVRAVLLRVNSPGGSVTASDHLFSVLKRFKASTQLPLFAFYEDVAASGGVYASAIADHIMAEPTCITGSIGVMMPRLQLKKLLDKVGVEEDPFLSAPLKDMGSMTREPTAEERRLLQEMVDLLYGRFVDVVLEGRGERITREKILELRSSFFLAEKAAAVGLVDEIGHIEDCYKMIRDKIGDAAMPVVAYEHKHGLMELLELLDARIARPAMTLEKWLPGLLSSGPLYLMPSASWASWSAGRFSGVPLSGIPLSPGLP